MECFIVVSLAILVARLWTIFEVGNGTTFAGGARSHVSGSAFESRSLQAPRAKRTYVNWNTDRAHQCANKDYMGDVHRFPDRRVERVFRVSRSIADRLLQCTDLCDVE